MGIYVVGMHRSGTSVVAAVASALTGLPSVRLAVPGNPDGQWERPELRPALDLLLASNRATWDHPPTDTAVLTAPAPWRAYARRVTARHLGQPFVWKDPRLCLTIDRWLDEPPAPTAGPARIVVVHRSPGAVAASLARREGWTIDRGLALWERTTRNAVRRLDGRQVFAVDHARLVADPGPTVEALADWLEVPITSRATDLVDTGAGGASGPAHASRSPEQAALAAVLADRHGPTRLDPAALGPESPTTGALLGSPTASTLATRTLRTIRALPRRHRLEVAGGPVDRGRPGA